MIAVERNGRGEWCVAVPMEGDDYSTTGPVRRLFRIPVSPDVEYGTALIAAKQLLRVGRGHEEQKER